MGTAYDAIAGSTKITGNVGEDVKPRASSTIFPSSPPPPAGMVVSHGLPPGTRLPRYHWLGREIHDSNPSSVPGWSVIGVATIRLFFRHRCRPAITMFLCVLQAWLVASAPVL